MTTAEAAKSLGVKVRRVQALIRQYQDTNGKKGLKAEKRGRDWYIEPGDLEAVRDRKPGYPAGQPRKIEAQEPKTPNSQE